MTGWFFQKFGSKYKPQLHFESFDRLADQALRLRDTMAEDDQIRKEVHKEVFQELAGTAEAEEKKASQALREAADTISESPAALQLRYLQVRRLENIKQQI